MIAGVDAADHFGKSPRGVVEHPWKHVGRTTNGDEEMAFVDCAPSRTPRGPTARHQPGEDRDDHDHAARALAAAGVRPEDPAWLDAGFESYDYDDGVGVCLSMVRLHSTVILLSFHLCKCKIIFFTLIIVAIGTVVL